MKKKYYLWLWEGVLTDYTDGVAFALAPDEATAWDALKKVNEVAWSFIRGFETNDTRTPEQLPSGIRPKRIDEAPFAFALYGGG